MSAPAFLDSDALSHQELLSAGSSRQRLVRGFAANALAPVTGTLVQILSVPIFLRSWGAQVYGEWLVLVAIPTYLLLSDMGFGSVAGNAMTLHVARNDRQRALAVFQSAHVLVGMIAVAVAVGAALLLFSAPIASWMHITHIPSPELRLIAGLLVAQVLLHVQNNVLVVAFRCEGLYAFGTSILNLATLVEVATATGIVFAGGTPLHAAVAYCATKAATSIVLALVLRRRIHWIRFGCAYANAGVARELLVPAFAYMAFPLGNAISMQGMILVIGSVSNPVAVVMFSTLRTLTRFISQSAGLIGTTIWPELSIAFGHGRLRQARQLHRRACQLTLLLALFAAAVLAAAGPFVYPLWVRGQVPMAYGLYYVLLLAAVANSFWNVSATATIARNAHEGVAMFYIVAAMLSLALTVLCMPRLGVSVASWSALALDSTMAVAAVRSSLQLLRDDGAAFWRSTFSLPVVLPTARSVLQEVRIWTLGCRTSQSFSREGSK